MRSYETNTGQKWASVTEIIGDATDKSKALTRWAANTACDYARDTLDPIKIKARMGGMDYDMVLWHSVEEVLSDAKHAFWKVSDKALSIGSEVHSMAEGYLKGNRPDTVGRRDEVIHAYTAFLDWLNSVRFEIIETEMKVFGYWYGGTLDIKAKLNGVTTIIDLKTSKSLFPGYRYQVAAYRATQPDAEACGVLRLDKETGIPEYRDTSKTFEQDLKVFNLMRDLFYNRHPRIAKKAGWINRSA
jgi:hypothetical protein